MEIEKLISALEDRIAFLRDSQYSDWAHMSVEEIVQELKAEIAEVKISHPMDATLLGFLFAPTYWGDPGNIHGQRMGEGLFENLCDRR